MPANTERLANLCATDACLARTRWIYLYEITPGAFSLVRNLIHKLRPSGITNTFSKVVISDHSLDVQIFNGDQAILINQPSRNPVVEVRALLLDVSMCALQKLDGFTSAMRTHPAPGNLALCASQLRLRFSIPARVINLRSIRECGKRCQADIYPDLFRASRQWLRFALTDKQGEPSASITLDGQGLNLSRQWPVQPDANIADLGKFERVSIKNSFESLAKGNAVISPVRLKSRIACLLAPAQPTKESIKGKGNTPENILQNIRIHACNVMPDLFNLRKLQSLVKIANGFPGYLVGVSTLLQCGVIQFAAKGQRRFKAFNLGLRRIEPILKSPYHEDDFNTSATTQEQQ
jgi:hypothetical protein